MERCKCCGRHIDTEFYKNNMSELGENESKFCSAMCAYRYFRQVAKTLRVKALKWKETNKCMY